MIHTGLVSVTFRGLSPQEIIRLVRQSGQQGIEWGGDIHVPHGDLASAREIGLRTIDVGLTTVSYGSYYRIGVSPNSGLAFETVLDTAVALQAPTIRVWAGNQGSKETSKAQYESVVEDGRRIADLASQAGIRVALEFHGGTLTDSPEAALQLRRDLVHPAIRLLWQPPAVDHADSLSGLDQILPYLGHLHVFYWTTTKSGDYRHPLVTGELFWQKALPLIAATGENYYALLEFVQGDAPDQYLSDAATLEHWIATVRN